MSIRRASRPILENPPSSKSEASKPKLVRKIFRPSLKTAPKSEDAPSEKVPSSEQQQIKFQPEQKMEVKQEPEPEPELEPTQKTEQQKEQKPSTIGLVVNIIKDIATSTQKREKIARPFTTNSKNYKCHFIGYGNKSKTITEKTMSWCLLDPTTATCDMTFCFDIEDVRKHIDEYNQKLQTSVQVAGQKQEKTRNPPMYQRLEIIKALGDRENIDIPEEMTDDFLFAVQTFEISQDQVVPNDLYGKILIDVVQTFILKNIGTGNGVDGIFWRYTKTALRKFVTTTTNIAVWILRNPYWVSVIKIVMKILRIALCIYSSFPTNQVGAILEALKSEFTKQLTGVGFGIPLFIVNTGLLLVECFSSVVNLQGWTFAKDCLGGLAQHGFRLYKIVAEVLNGLVDFSGTRLLVASCDTIANHFDEYLGVLAGDVNSGIALDVRYVVQMQHFVFHDWNRVIFLLVLQYVPPQLIIKMILSLAKLIPYLEPLINSFEILGVIVKQAKSAVESDIAVKAREFVIGKSTYVVNIAKKFNFLQIFKQWLEMDKVKIAAVELFNELYEWCYDLIPCLFSVAVRKIKCIFGDNSSCSKEYVPCCMAQIIVGIQAQFERYFSKRTIASALNAVYTGVGELLYWFYPFAGSAVTMTPELQIALADLVSTNPQLLDNNPAMQEALQAVIDGKIDSKLSEQEQNKIIDNILQKHTYGLDDVDRDTLKKNLFNTSNEKNIQDVPVPQTLYDAFSPEGEAHLWASLSDEREKNKVFDKPLYTLILEDGTQIPFYLFVWKDDAVFEDGYKMHVSVMAQEIQQHYPEAVYKFRGRYFVLLDQLPREVVKHMLLFLNPIVDLTRL